MFSLDYVWKKLSNDEIATFASRPDLFFWHGECNKLRTPALVIMAYFEWRKEYKPKDSGYDALILDSPAVGRDARGVLISDQKENDVDEDEKGGNDFSISPQFWKKYKKVSDQLKCLFDAGRSYDELLERKTQNAEIQHLQAELIRHASSWRSYESVVAKRRLPVRIVSKAATPALIAKYNLNGRGYDSFVLRTIYSDWYLPNFVHQRPRKGTKILWIWSFGPSTYKTTFVEEGIVRGAGQIVQQLKAERNGWIQNYKERRGSVNWIDGFSEQDVKNGISIKFLEAVGEGKSAPVPQRNLHIQPETAGEDFIVCANNDYPPFYPEPDALQILRARVLSIQLSKNHTLYNARNFLLEIGGKPPLPPPSNDIPRHIRIPTAEQNDDE